MAVAGPLDDDKPRLGQHALGLRIERVAHDAGILLPAFALAIDAEIDEPVAEEVGMKGQAVYVLFEFEQDLRFGDVRSGLEASQHPAQFVVAVVLQVYDSARTRFARPAKTNGLPFRGCQVSMKSSVTVLNSNCECDSNQLRAASRGVPSCFLQTKDVSVKGDGFFQVGHAITGVQ